VSCRASVDVVESILMCYGVGSRTLTPCCFNPFLRVYTVPSPQCLKRPKRNRFGDCGLNYGRVLWLLWAQFSGYCGRSSLAIVGAVLWLLWAHFFGYCGHSSLVIVGTTVNVAGP
jgi:hypothetical protein